MSKSLTLGERLKHARKLAGYSQRELAKELKVTDKAVSTYEVGRAEPSFKMMKKISKLVGKPISYFDTDYEVSESNLEGKLDRIEEELKEIRIMLQKKDLK